MVPMSNNEKVRRLHAITLPGVPASLQDGASNYLIYQKCLHNFVIAKKQPFTPESYFYT